MLNTRLTEAFGLDHPILSAPMAFAAGGKLAAAVTGAGGLGFIGGAYGDQEWLEQQFTAAGNARVGCGFITWALEGKEEVLDAALAHRPAAIFLSFADPAPYARRIADADVPLICQVQTLKDGLHAADCGAKVVVAQGSEAGGHGEARATMTLVPEIADAFARSHPDTLLLAAGGIADGRGLAAALMLGADGVLVGSRFWASDEAEVHPRMIEAAIAAKGDDTVRSSVMDIARRLNWPERYTARVLKNAFTERWHGDLEGLLADQDHQADLWREAWVAGNTDVANTFVGEAAGLIKDRLPAAEIVETMVQEAEDALERGVNLRL